MADEIKNHQLKCKKTPHNQDRREDEKRWERRKKGKKTQSKATYIIRKNKTVKGKSLKCLESIKLLVVKCLRQ